MTVSADILLGIDGDIDFSTGDLRLAVSIKQDIQVRLRTYLEEWFLDTTVGTPWRQDVLVKDPNLARINDIIRQRILDTDGVIEVTKFVLDYSPSGRNLTITWEASTEVGDIEGVEVIS